MVDTRRPDRDGVRLPGDLIFILFGAVPLVIASIKGYVGMRVRPERVRIPIQ